MVKLSLDRGADLVHCWLIISDKHQLIALQVYLNLYHNFT